MSSGSSSSSICTVAAAAATERAKQRDGELVGHMEYLISVHSALQAYVMQRFSEVHEKFAMFDASGAWQIMTSEETTWHRAAADLDNGALKQVFISQETLFGPAASLITGFPDTFFHTLQLKLGTHATAVADKQVRAFKNFCYDAGTAVVRLACGVQTPPGVALSNVFPVPVPVAALRRPTGLAVARMLTLSAMREVTYSVTLHAIIQQIHFFCEMSTMTVNVICRRYDEYGEVYERRAVVRIRPLVCRDGSAVQIDVFVQ